MASILWAMGAVAIWVLGVLSSSKRPARSGVPLFIGCLGTGVGFAMMAGLSVSSSPVPPVLLTRLLWSTILLTVPIWATFSFRFGREQRQGAGRLELISLGSLWLTAGLLVLGGLTRTPLLLQSSPEEGLAFLLEPPYGQPLLMHVLAGTALVLWNLHATLETGRISGRRRVSLAVYSLIPLAVTAFYLFAETLLYGGRGVDALLPMVPAAMISLGALTLSLRKPGLGEGSIPSGRTVVYAPTVLVALGISLVALALLAEAFRGLGLEGVPRWYQGVALLILALVFALWVFPGLREEIQRFADRGLYAARSDYKEIWERVDPILGATTTPEELSRGLASALRATFGPLHVQIWIAETGSADLAPVGDPHIPRLSPGHPLRQALQGRQEALLLTGEAAKVSEVPLHLACEVLGQRHGLRVFFALRFEGRMIGILGCGPAGGRTFHPEDLELLEAIGCRVASVVSRLGAPQRAGEVDAPRVSPGGGSLGREADSSDPERGALAMGSRSDGGSLPPVSIDRHPRMRSQ